MCKFICENAKFFVSLHANFMFRLIRVIWILALVVLLSACNLTKFVPQGQYLLDRVNIVVTEDSVEHYKPTAKEKIAYANLSGKLNNYLRQKPNTKILGFWRLQLDIYNTAPLDTTTKARKRLQRNAFRMGEAPVIYDEDATAASILQLKKAMDNSGYFLSSVDTTTSVKKRRMTITYHVYARQPYTLKSYKTRIDFDDVRRIANDGQSLLRAGDQFDTQTMDNERGRIAERMKDDGFFYYDKGFMDFEADSSYRTNEVALVMKPQEYMKTLPDSLVEQIFTRQYISRVCFHMDYDPDVLPDSIHPVVNEVGAYEFSYVDKKLLREKVLQRNCRIRPGNLYSAKDVERTYELLNSLGPVKYVDIRFEPVATDSIECHITLTRNKLNSVSAEIEGTYSAGDWGIAVGAGYINKNIFRGAEQLSLNGRFGYEWRENGSRGLEAKADVGIRWPNSLEVKLGYNYQNRPDEYTRTISSSGLYYTIHHRNSNWSHVFNLVDFSYVWLPHISDAYREQIIDRSSVLRYSYENHFIMDWSYTGYYSNKRADRPNRSSVNLRYSVETAGNVLYGISRLAHLQPNEAGQYEVFNIPFSQYAKGEVDFTFIHVLQPNHRLVSHVGIGAVYPYLNADAVPFEKRYFSGGSNSVRGWQARTLGPGAYSGVAEDGSRRYDLQAGDIRLDLNLEYRWHVWNFLHLAAFTDAGNIWTIKEYSSQPYGVIGKEFYKQIAWSYGVGVRLDFSILVFRIDMGVKLYDPTRIHTDGKTWRTVPNGLGWKDDFTMHFAIGYPF